MPRAKKHRKPETSLPGTIRKTLGYAAADWNKISHDGILTARSKSHLFNRHYNGIGIKYPEVEGVDHTQWSKLAAKQTAKENREHTKNKTRLILMVGRFAARHGLPFLTKQDKLAAIRALRDHYAKIAGDEPRPVFHEAGAVVMTRVSEFRPSMPNMHQVRQIERANQTWEREQAEK